MDEYSLVRHKYMFYQGPTIVEHFERDIQNCGYCNKMSCCKLILYYLCCCFCQFCCPPQKTKIGVRPGYGCVVTVNDDIYAASLGPAKISLCCTNRKSLHWVNTGEKTVELKRFPITLDTNETLGDADILILYRVTDIVNHVFNVHKLRPSTPVTLFDNVMQVFRNVMAGWNEPNHHKEVERCIRANLSSVLYNTFKGTVDDLRNGGLPKEAFTMLNNRVKYLGIVIHDVSILKMKINNKKDAAVGN